MARGAQTVPTTFGGQMAEGAAQSPVASKPEAGLWTWVQRLLRITGVLGLVLLIATLVSELPLRGVEVLILAILAIPFVFALVAFWQFRMGKQGRSWWLGVVAGLLGLVAAFITGGFAPIVLPLSVLISFFDLYFLLAFLTNLTYVVLAVTGVLTLVAHFRDQRPRQDQVPVSQSSGVFFDADGNQVVPAYMVQTSPTAVIAFVLVWFVSPIGLVLGYVALNEIRRSHGTRSGEGLAKAAIIIGWVWLALAVVIVAALLAL
jgi:hypothetical protein